MKTIFPPALKKGSTIGITCPAGYMAKEKAEQCIATLQGWGFNVLVGRTLGSNSTNYFSGSDEERTDELQAMLDNKKIDAILFGRGGYGVSRIIDQLNFKRFCRQPKWLIGFSDITVLHCHILSNYGIASVHAQMAAAFNDAGKETISVKSIEKILKGELTQFTAPVHPFNIEGTANGKLIGGNLTLLANIIGTKSDYKTNKRILFIEDIGEYMYSTDRLLMQLKRSGKLSKLAGLIFGGFTDMKDTERSFGKTMDELLRFYARDLKIPVCYNFPVSHTADNVPLVIGGTYTLKVNNEGVLLQSR